MVQIQLILGMYIIRYLLSSVCIDMYLAYVFNYCINFFVNLSNCLICKRCIASPKLISVPRNAHTFADGI